ncbi:hypothetical protein AB0C87_08500 [Actinomadura sp. NPDC048021]|uniref:hypothetical protein n=1 Tax=Actinomadura sp. NPDC048021 TaxID=3155385 RepID=UPI0033F6CC30
MPHEPSTPEPVPATDDPVAGTDTTAPSSPSSATANGAVTRVPLIALCVTEITSWGILYYAFPVLAPDINHDTGWSTGAITAAFSAALVLAALGGIPSGERSTGTAPGCS